MGVCLGFLPHNFYPARIFMGDSGAMLIGLVFAGAAIVVTGQIDPKVVSARQSLPAFLPIVLPAAVMVIPLVDMTLAVFRRIRAGHSPFHADRMHLHHRLLALGHSHRRAVAIMYVWTAVCAFGAAALVVVSTTTAVILVVIAVNAVNFVDGLDGLAAGVIAIGGTAFFVYTYLLARNASPGDWSSLATLVVAALVGVCLGFLPHNFYPARIFMGDSGAMLIGLVLAGASIIVTGQIDPKVVSARQSLPAFLPIVLPAAVMLLPLVDMTLAVFRRLRAGHSPFHADRMHLHHRLLALGHSHRRAVAIMYVWTAVCAFGAAALVVVSTTTALILLGVGIVAAVLLTVGPLRHRGRPVAAPKEA